MPVAEIKEEVTTVPSVNIDSIDYIVFTYDTAWYWMFPTGSRTAELTKEEIAQAELLLLEQIEKHNQERSEDYEQRNARYPHLNFQKESFLIENPTGYARQYVTVINPDGQKVLFINAFCSLQGHDYWKAQLVRVRDGGDCYFQIMINLTTNEVVKFSVNGVA